MSWVIGIDLGGTKIALGLVSSENKVVAQRRIATNSEEGPQSVVERIATQVAELEQTLPAGEIIAALGIGCPGPVDHVTGSLLTLVNLPGISNTPLRQLLSDRLGVPVRLDHDAKVAALGDFHYGAGRARDHMIYVTMGTGVGAAIIINSELHYGESNTAGEVGHITVDRHGALCACGSRGCLETYTSGPWLSRRYQEALQKTGQATDQVVSAGEIVTLAGQGDPVARSVLDAAGEALGIAVASMAMIINVELFVIGGSMSKAGDLLLEPARRAARQYSFRAVGERIKIVASELGDDGPLLGGAWLARQILQHRAGSHVP